MCEKKKKTKKMSDFLKAYISGTAGAIYFTSGMCSLPICWHLHSKFGLVWSRDHGATNLCIKTYFVLHVNILTLCTHAPFSWAAQHTTVCLDYTKFIFSANFLLPNKTELEKSVK